MSQPPWQRPFFTILAGQIFSVAGSSLVQFALIWWLTDTTGSAVTLATATVMGQIPVIVLGPIAGTLVDRWPLRWTLILSDGIFGLLIAFLGVLFWLDLVQVWHVYVTLFLRALADLFVRPAVIATTTAMVPRDQLARVGGIRATLEGGLYLLAPLVGALILERMGVQGVLPLAVLTAVLAIAPLVFVAIPRIQGQRVARGIRGVVRGLADGWRTMVRRRGLWQLEITSAMWALLWTPAMSLIPLLVKDHFRGGAMELGWLQSAYGLGLVSGGLVLSAWGGFRRNMLTCAAGSLATGCAALILALAPANALWLGILAAAVAGFASPAITSGFLATLQKVVDPALQGRYWGLHSSLNRAIGPLALAGAAPLAERYGVRPLWLVAAMGALLIGSLRRTLPAVYHLEDEPSPPSRTP